MQTSQARSSEASVRERDRLRDPQRSETGNGSSGSIPWKRSLHANLSYVPIGGLFFALIGDVLYFITGAHMWAWWANVVLGLSLVISVPAAMLGVVAMKSIEREPRSRRLAMGHGVASVIALLSVSAGWASRLGGDPTIGSTLLIWSGVGVMVVAGLVGGELQRASEPINPSGATDVISEVRRIQPASTQIDERTAAHG